MEKDIYVYFLKDYDYFDYIFLKSHIKLDIFVNKNIINRNFLNENYGNIYNVNSLLDTSVSNINLYKNQVIHNIYNKRVNYDRKTDLLSIYSLYLTKKGEFVNQSYLYNYRIAGNLKYYFGVEQDNYFMFLKKYFHLVNDSELRFYYYYFFFTKILIIKSFLIFNIFVVHSIIFNFACVVVFIILSVYIYNFIKIYIIYDKKYICVKYINK